MKPFINFEDSEYIIKCLSNEAGWDEAALRHVIKYFVVHLHLLKEPDALEDIKPGVGKTSIGQIVSVPMKLPHYGPAPDHTKKGARCVIS